MDKNLTGFQNLSGLKLVGISINKGVEVLMFKYAIPSTLYSERQ